MAQITLTILKDSTSSTAGKFYAGIHSAQCPFGIHGQRTSGTKGKLVPLENASAVRNKMTTKRRGGYVTGDLSDLPLGAQQKIKMKLAEALGIPEDSITLTDDSIIYGDTSGASPSAPNTSSSKPRRRARTFDVWI